MREPKLSMILGFLLTGPLLRPSTRGRSGPVRRPSRHASLEIVTAVAGAAPTPAAGPRRAAPVLAIAPITEHRSQAESATHECSVAG